jgi:hypothetical protein
MHASCICSLITSIPKKNYPQAGGGCENICMWSSTYKLNIDSINKSFSIILQDNEITSRRVEYSGRGPLSYDKKVRHVIGIYLDLMARDGRNCLLLRNYC